MLAPKPRPPAIPTALEEPGTPPALLHETLVAEQALTDADLSGARARGVAVRASRLQTVLLSGAELEALELSDVELRGCDLANLRAIHGSWMRVSAQHCRMTGLALPDSLLRDVTIRGSRIDLASFGGCRLQRVTFDDCRLTQTDFLEAELDTVRFVDCDLTGLDLRGARMRGCELRGNRLEDVRGVESLRGCTMPWPDIVGAAGLWASALGIQALADDELG